MLDLPDGYECTCKMSGCLCLKHPQIVTRAQRGLPHRRCGDCQRGRHTKLQRQVPAFATRELHALDRQTKTSSQN
jgi:hypothetical protein